MRWRFSGSQIHSGEEGKHEAGLIFAWAGVWPTLPHAAAVAHNVANHITMNAHGCSELSGHKLSINPMRYSTLS